MTTPVASPGRIPIPALGDEPNIPADLLAAATDLDFKVENRFASVGDRDAYLPAATTSIGVRCFVTTTGRRYIVWPTTGGNQWFEVRGLNRLVVPDDTTMNSLVTVPDGMEVHHSQFGVVWQRQSGIWVPTNLGTTIRGKMWRTAGFSGFLTNTTRYGIPLQVSRLTGGFTWGGGGTDAAGPATSYLAVPYDGIYDLDFSGYLSGGAANVFANIVKRNRPSGGADNDVGSATWYKASASFDHPATGSHAGVPLKAGDRLYYDTLTYTNSGGNVSFYGTTEMHIHLTAAYVGPLNGATPL